MDDINHVIQIKEKVESKLLEMPNVNAVGVGYKITGGKKTDEVVIRVYVNEKINDMPTDKQIPNKIDGIKTDVIQQSQYAEPHSNIGNNFASDEIIGGINIGFNASTHFGTAGTIAIDRSNGKTMLLSCHHVLGFGALHNLGVEICHPANTGRRIATVQRTGITEKTDAGVARLHDNLKFRCEIDKIGPVIGVVDNQGLMNMLESPVKKSGARSGLTTGTIEDINITRTMDYRSLGLGTPKMHQQILIESDNPSRPFSGFGDSGSCVVDDAGRIVAMVIAGANNTTLATPIEEVSKALNIGFCRG